MWPSSGSSGDKVLGAGLLGSPLLFGNCVGTLFGRIFLGFFFLKIP